MDGEWGSGEMERWGDGVVGRWGGGEMGRWGGGEMGRGVGADLCVCPGEQLDKRAIGKDGEGCRGRPMCLPWREMG